MILMNQGLTHNRSDIHSSMIFKTNSGTFGGKTTSVFAFGVLDWGQGCPATISSVDGSSQIPKRSPMVLVLPLKIQLNPSVSISIRQKFDI
jgi:hypothetical protein